MLGSVLNLWVAENEKTFQAATSRDMIAMQKQDQTIYPFCRSVLDPIIAS